MDRSQLEHEMSLSPSQILERLELLRQLQIMQRGKLQKQRLQYHESVETSSTSKNYNSSDFTDSTSYNRLPQELTNGSSYHISNIVMNVEEKDLSDGVSVLNLSQESQFLENSPLSSRSKASSVSQAQSVGDKSLQNVDTILCSKTPLKKHIELDEMPILSPKKDFESILLEKLNNEKKMQSTDSLKTSNVRNKKPFLKRGEGMARFGLNKKDLVVEKTSSLPWRNKSLNTQSRTKIERQIKSNNRVLDVVDSKSDLAQETVFNCVKSKLRNDKPIIEEVQPSVCSYETIDSSNCEIHAQNKPSPVLKKTGKANSLLKINKETTWATILTKEQDDFLKQLKQSDYYKNFISPAKSIISEVSCDDESLIKLRQEKETADQNMFNLLENKVMHDSFNLESSFFNKFLANSQLACSGESTPLVLQKCLAKNPNLLHILPEIIKNKSCGDTNSDFETCDSECTDCGNETCTSMSSCCSSCNSEKTNHSRFKKTKTTRKNEDEQKEVVLRGEKEKCHSDIMTENETMKANLSEMNNKLLATSDLLKERLKELEDEIDTFRKENANLTKVRDEVDKERIKLYEEKAAYEQKFNEEKILSEYYLAEEKEKLNKQKLIYEKHVREIRGRLNKKDKDEVVNLKKEISELREEIKIKDAKSTSTIARLRNQLKILDKDKSNLQDAVAKMEKENRRLHHSNEMTRRLTNIKYLEQINKKLSSITPKETQSRKKEDSNIKYKAYEIERQSRARKVQNENVKTVRPRAKSVPNLNVISRYAKYFSQKDVASDIMNKNTPNFDTNSFHSDSDGYDCNYDYKHYHKLDDSNSNEEENISNDTGIESNLERLYAERFKSASPSEMKSTLNSSNSTNCSIDRTDPHIDRSNGFFLRKTDSYGDSRSLNKASSILQTSTESTRSKSPITVHSQRPFIQNSTSHLKNIATNLRTPASILSNRSSGSQTSLTNNNMSKDLNLNIEPVTSSTSLTRTDLNSHEEIKRSDGTREIRFQNGNVKFISPDGKYTKFIYYNGDVKENFFGEGRIKYFYAETKTHHTTHPDGLEVLEFSDGQIEKRYKDGSSEIRLPNGSVRYQDPKNQHVKEEWRFPDGTTMTVSATGEQRVTFTNGQVEVHAKDHKRREFPDGTVKLVYNDGTSETRYASGRVRIKDNRGNLIMDSAPEF